MSALFKQSRKRSRQLAVKEFVNGRRQTHANSIWFPQYRVQIQLIFFFSAREYALGAGDRQFESGHPEFYFVALYTFTFPAQKMQLAHFGQV